MWALCRSFFCLNAGILGIFYFSKVLSNSLLRVWTGELQGWSKAFPSQLLYLCWWSPGRVIPKEQVPTPQPSSPWLEWSWEGLSPRVLQGSSRGMNTCPSGICPGTGASSKGCAKEWGDESLESQVFALCVSMSRIYRVLLSSPFLREIKVMIHVLQNKHHW